jgi:uncharacterized membrane protein
MRNPVAVAYPDAGAEDDFMDRLGVKLHNNSGAVVVVVRREAELQEALAGQAAAV